MSIYFIITSTLLSYIDILFINLLFPLKLKINSMIPKIKNIIKINIKIIFNVK